MKNPLEATIGGWTISATPAGSTSGDHDALDPLAHDATIERIDQEEHPRIPYVPSQPDDPPTLDPPRPEVPRWIYLTSAGDVATRDGATITGLPGGVSLQLDPDQLDHAQTSATWELAAPPSTPRGPGQIFTVGHGAGDVDLTTDTGAGASVVRGSPHNLLVMDAGNISYQAWGDPAGSSPRTLTGLPAGLSMVDLGAVIVYETATTITRVLVGW